MPFPFGFRVRGYVEHEWAPAESERVCLRFRDWLVESGAEILRTAPGAVTFRVPLDSIWQLSPFSSGLGCIDSGNLKVSPTPRGLGVEVSFSTRRLAVVTLGFFSALCVVGVATSAVPATPSGNVVVRTGLLWAFVFVSAYCVSIVRTRDQVRDILDASRRIAGSPSE